MHEDGGVGDNIVAIPLVSAQLGRLMLQRVFSFEELPHWEDGINFIRDRDDHAMGRPYISFRDHLVPHWCRNTWSGMCITDAMGRTNIVRAKIAKRELTLPMNPSLGVSIRSGSKAFCIPQRHREKDSEEPLNKVQGSQELSTRLLFEARRRSTIDDGRRMTHGAPYDEPLTTKSIRIVGRSLGAPHLETFMKRRLTTKFHHRYWEVPTLSAWIRTAGR